MTYRHTRRLTDTGGGFCGPFFPRLAQKFKKTGSGRVEWEQYRRSGSYEPEPHAFGYFALVEDLRRLDPKKENVEWEEASSSAFMQVRVYERRQRSAHRRV